MCACVCVCVCDTCVCVCVCVFFATTPLTVPAPSLHSQKERERSGRHCLPLKADAVSPLSSLSLLCSLPRSPRHCCQQRPQVRPLCDDNRLRHGTGDDERRAQGSRVLVERFPSVCVCLSVCLCLGLCVCVCVCDCVCVFSLALSLADGGRSLTDLCFLFSRPSLSPPLPPPCPCRLPTPPHPHTHQGRRAGSRSGQRRPTWPRC